jgi:hypothetical protein
MNKRELLKNFIEQEMAGVLKEKLSPEEFDSVMLGLNMILEESVDNVYDAIELANKLMLSESENSLLKKAVDNKDQVIKMYRKNIKM